MGTSVLIMVNQVIAMFVMLMVGFAARRGGLMTKQGTKSMSNVVLYVANPATIAVSLMSDFQPHKLGQLCLCAICTALGALVAAVVARLVLRDPPDHTSGGRTTIARFAVVFSNMGFIGIPLVNRVVGTDYVFYVSACIAMFQLMVWTYGVWLMTGSLERASPAKVLTNPAVIALAIGLVMFTTGLRPPAPIISAAESLGNLNTGLAMLVLGSYLAHTDVAALLRDRRTYLICALRLVVLPLFVVLVMHLVPDGVLDPGTKLVIVITQATPVAGITAMFADIFDADSEFAAGLVSFSTLVSLVTMPLVLALA